MNIKKIRELKLTWKGKDINFLLPLLGIGIVSIGLSFYAYHNWNSSYSWQRSIMFMCIGLFFYIIRPSSQLHRIHMDSLEMKHKFICGFVIGVTCLTAVYVMGISDWWSDKGPNYHFQYEAVTEALINGNLHLDMEVSPELLAMENPYDFVARSEQGVPYYWDHAFYNGHYYMYFGVVPAVLIMVPLKLIGISLYSYQVTQIMVVLIICGMFAVFREITKKMCPEMPLSGFLSVSLATTWISVWYAVKYPALYCTANSGGICMAVWGFYFCYKAFVMDDSKKDIVIHAFLGALCSALTFGCRPTIGFYCLTLLPLLFYYLKKCNNWKEFLKVFFVFCIPFVIVAVLLMLYNYARFESPFEFGQSYQLTITDQHAYSDSKIKLNKCLSGMWFHLFNYEDVSENFPFIHHDGSMVLFPILFLGLGSFGLSENKERGNTMIKGMTAMICLAVVIICVYHVTWAPVVFRRYSLDINFLMCFLVMFGVCGLYWHKKNHVKVSYLLSLLAAQTILVCFLLYFVEFDYSIATHQTELWQNVKNFVVFWKA